MGKYYAVRNGHNTGVYSDWSSAKSQVNGYSGNEYKSFNTAAEANAYMNGGSSGGGSGGGYSGSSYGGYSGSSNNGYGGSSGGYGATSYDSDYDSGYSGSTYRTGYSSAHRSSSNTGRETQTVYTDGSCINNGKSGAKAGWGAHWGDSRDCYGSIPNGTNNSGELHAIKDTLEKISANPGNKDYKIMSDSQYSIDSVTKWGDRWEQNGYKTASGADVKNQDLVRDVRDLIKDCESQGTNVSFGKVKGHSNDPGNEAADRLARMGAYS